MLQMKITSICRKVVDPCPELNSDCVDVKRGGAGHWRGRAAATLGRDPCPGVRDAAGDHPTRL